MVTEIILTGGDMISHEEQINEVRPLFRSHIVDKALNWISSPGWAVTHHELDRSPTPALTAQAFELTIRPQGPQIRASILGNVTVYFLNPPHRSEFLMLSFFRIGYFEKNENFIELEKIMPYFMWHGEQKEKLDKLIYQVGEGPDSYLTRVAQFAQDYFRGERADMINKIRSTR